MGKWRRNGGGSWLEAAVELILCHLEIITDDLCEKSEGGGNLNDDACLQFLVEPCTLLSTTWSEVGLTPY